MDILFCTTPNISLFYNAVLSDLSIGACEVAGALEHHGFKVDYYDLNLFLNKRRDARVLDYEEEHLLCNEEYFIENYGDIGRFKRIQYWLTLMARSIEDKQYSCIALSMSRVGVHESCSRATLFFTILLSKVLKKKINVPIFVGGAYVLSLVGEKCYKKVLSLTNENVINKVFLTQQNKESFPTWLNDTFKNKNPLKDNDFYIYDNDIRINAWSKKSIIPKFNTKNSKDGYYSPEEVFLPEVLEKYKILQKSEDIFFAPMRFSLGCQFRCSFCRAGNDTFFDHENVDDIVEQLQLLKSAGITNFKFFNSNINFNKRFLKTFLDKIISLNLKIRYSDSANLRIFNEDIARRLVESGCVKLWFGAETVSDKMLKIINKGTNKKKIISSLLASSQSGIWTSCNFIYSFPHEDDDDFAQLCSFIQNNEFIDTCQINQYQLLRNTEMREQSEKYKIIVKSASENAIFHTYDEIGRMTWEEKTIEAIKRKKILENLFSFGKRAVYSCDASLFMMHSLGMSKEDMKSVFDHTLKTLLANNELDLYSFKKCGKPKLCNKH